MELTLREITKMFILDHTFSDPIQSEADQQMFYFSKNLNVFRSDKNHSIHQSLLLHFQYHSLTSPKIAFKFAGLYQKAERSH